MNAEVERYLDDACRGLVGTRRADVRAELYANIVQCALDFRVGGMSESEAVREALREFGCARQANSGLLRVHLLPRVLHWLLLVFALSSIGFGTVSLARAASHAAPPAHEERP
ncbi:permease prefix domain 1-containing protein [Deinococcus yavapaiensis]|uniref:Uncharacterized protein n=1 Tax=Deinococcus yavapaiensis KR-236 TaxID=694435 RepID=A0A318SEY7_9DEIO|nr:permease prefix domain 1-containing protein [Deinococcus yavapaiensis]PYE55262.1 hypothetical protein DES52_10393 [Deinococcus yavapaiensis KR-236]